MAGGQGINHPYPLCSSISPNSSGEIDETLLDALTDYVKRQRKRLSLPATGTGAATDSQ